ncbi:Oidioi.mRNA.OKI2018_I69.XSR.g13666.t1.cds [Oikopleura dioica]|uniref:Oidioi.mRNA.OKI2018_I69.XSR.g13666.t1.cds n=1 Tax=Oikopleura dioica TaxID=34765 RepID=A0ABN7SBF6_OIKDI|nr:Oidioi.mRNA.OKI2018_I69.XSR.g13666.t1.cds [Oikopleura dioica]
MDEEVIEIHTLSEFEGLDEKTESTDEESMIKVMAKSRLPSEDSGIGINDGDNASSGKVLYPTTPNMALVRLELNGRDGSDNKAVWENTGLVPKYYKPYSLIETDGQSSQENGPVYKCHFCHMHYKGHNSIVYHARRHVGDYPYKCGEPGCNFHEVCKSGLSSHTRRTGHRAQIRIEGPEREAAPARTVTPVSKVEKMPDPDQFASNLIKERTQNAIGKQFLPESQKKFFLSERLQKHESMPPFCEDFRNFKPIRHSSLVPSVPESQRAKVYEEATGMIPKYMKPFRILPVTENKVVYKCDRCGSNYTSYDDIVSHARRHYGDHPYRCITCGFAGVCRSALEMHMFEKDHPKAIFLKHSNVHEFILKPKQKPDNATEKRSRVSSPSPQITPRFMQTQSNGDPIKDDPALRLQYARAMQAQAKVASESGWNSTPIKDPMASSLDMSNYFLANGFPWFASYPFPPSVNQTGQPLATSAPPKKPQQPPKASKKAKAQEDTLKRTPRSSPAPVADSDVPKKVPKPPMSPLTIKKETLELPKTPEPSREKLLIVPKNGVKRKAEEEQAPDLTIKMVPEIPDYEHLIWLAEKVQARNDLLTHNWDFCSTCKSAFYNTDLYMSHFASSPECRPPK